MAKRKSDSVPKAMQETYNALVELTDAFCRERLNEDYASLCRSALAALARKRPSPLTRGRPEIWSCAVIHALGTINFLFDRTQNPHVTYDDLSAHFGANKNTITGKSKQIQDMLGMSRIDATWMLPDMIAENPMVWMIRVNGFIVDARSLPREIQEMAYEKGIIPYIPDDQE